MVNNEMFCPFSRGICVSSCAMRMDDECAIRVAADSLAVLGLIDPESAADAVNAIAGIETSRDGEVLVNADVFVRGGNIDTSI